MYGAHLLLYFKSRGFLNLWCVDIRPLSVAIVGLFGVVESVVPIQYMIFLATQSTPGRFKVLHPCTLATSYI